MKDNNIETLPKVSVITVVRNDKDHIEATINSLFDQDYPNIEYIVIDGASTDGTFELLSQYSDKIDILISEPDDGIYDAMNKGIRICSGDYIGILNSGDEYADIHAISSVFLGNVEGADVIYGDSIEVSDDIEKVIKVGSFNLMEYGPVYRHGSSFVKTSVHQKHVFDIARHDLGYALDWEQIYRLYKSAYTFKNCNCVIEKYRKDGISNNDFMNAWYNFVITASYDKKVFKLLYYFKSLLALFIHKKREEKT